MKSIFIFFLMINIKREEILFYYRFRKIVKLIFESEVFLLEVVIVGIIIRKVEKNRILFY